ncbi:cell division suppressor protein YneA [Planomicrobium okeanokoites]|uniref:LysM peptidoglycan-binding domain-containing protein n=1 Tax=Planomicrobium okeanokoites TaxID=244 RepID=A0ABV7KPD2_PLAOK|nr:LysM peptidoglycan-binding domain-containing protein [Planomicrobium okeanokoites]TAA71327.1 LysM peptidoglycan-binding domain-containing protein [Planomicrobium okeanokoites]
MAYIRRNSFVFLFFTLVLILSFYSALSHNSEEAHMVQLKIEQGDTLWTLADEYSGNIPHHEWIDGIMKENKLNAPVITAGQTLKIPDEHLDYVPDGTYKLASDSE